MKAKQQFRTIGEKTEGRCPQCLVWKDYPKAFLNRSGTASQWCRACRDRWNPKLTSPEERRAKRKPIPENGAHHVHLVLSSKNKKTGPIPVSMTERGSCPDTCGFKNNGCYAEEHHWLKQFWINVPWKLTWQAFCRAISNLPTGQLWRHNEAGDLPGRGDFINPFSLLRLVEANRGKKGFTFTHKPVLNHPQNAAAVRYANRNGFTVNVSAESLEQADAIADLMIGPVCVVLPSDASPRAKKTPAGRQVVVCPAEIEKNVITCNDCQLCAAPARRSIIGFRAHGNAAALVTSIVKKKPNATFNNDNSYVAVGVDLAHGEDISTALIRVYPKM